MGSGDRKDSNSDEVFVDVIVMRLSWRGKLRLDKRNTVKDLRKTLSEAVNTPELLTCEGGWKIMAGGRQLQPDGAVLEKILGTKRSLLVLPPDDQPRGPSRLAKAQKIIQATEELAKEENNRLHL
eukprot:383343_1